MRLGFVGLLCLGLLAGCSRSKGDLPPPEADKQPMVATVSSPAIAPSPAEDPQEELKHSNGLGLGMTALAMRHGPIKEYMKPWGPGVPRGATTPGFADNKEASLGYVSEKQLAISIHFEGIPSSLDNVSDAHPYLMTYLPKDSQLLQTVSYHYPNEDLSKIYNEPVETYYSPWLATRLSPTEWQKYGPPGQFYVHYLNREAFIRVGIFTPRPGPAAY